MILDLPAKQRQIVMLEADKAVCKQINRIMREDNAIPIDNLRSSEKLFK